MESPDLFTARLDLITRIVASVARRNGFDEHVAEDFRSLVWEKLLENDQARLTRYAGRSTWQTYLTVVITNLARDFGNHLWGKWRPSARARDLGADAVRLEMLLHRDGRALNEAVAIVVEASTQGVDARAVHRMYGQLPLRKRREIVGLEAVGDLPAPERADADFWRDEEHEELKRIGSVLEKALDGLAPKERLMIKMRYFDGCTLAGIGEALGLTPQSVDRRIRKVLGVLRGHFD